MPRTNPTAEAIRADPTAPALTYAYGFAGALKARVPGGVWRPIRAAQPSGGGTLTGRTSEDFAVLLELQARAAGYEIVAEDTAVDDGLAPGCEINEH